MPVSPSCISDELLPMDGGMALKQSYKVWCIIIISQGVYIRSSTVKIIGVLVGTARLCLILLSS